MFLGRFEVFLVAAAGRWLVLKSQPCSGWFYVVFGSLLVARGYFSWFCEAILGGSGWQTTKTHLLLLHLPFGATAPVRSTSPRPLGGFATFFSCALSSRRSSLTDETGLDGRRPSRRRVSQPLINRARRTRWLDIKVCTGVRRI